MARTISIIQDEIIAAKNADAALAGLTSSSATAIWRLWTYIIAVCIWTLEKLFDLHLMEVKGILATQVPHKPSWYETKAKAFLYGFTYVGDSDIFAIEGYSPEQIVAAQVVKYAAATESNRYLRLKLAGETAGELAPLLPAQLTAVKAYMNRVKDAGVRLIVDSNVADDLKLALTVYYDPLVLDAAGARLDGTSATPVKDAIVIYLRDGVQFNKLFIPTKLIDALQEVEGVVIPVPTLVQAKYGNLAFANVGVEYLPDAGYIRINTATNLIITYIPHEPV